MSKVKVDLEGKVILVTGYPGFIGVNLVMRLLKKRKPVRSSVSTI